MQQHQTTPTTSGARVCLPFGELFEQAMRGLPASVTNSQREDFLKAKPSVFGTLDRFATATLDAGVTGEQWERFCFSLYMALLDKRVDRVGVPDESLAEACAADEAAEGVEDVAEITAIADPSASRLASLFDRALCSMSAKRRMARAAHRDFMKAVAR